MSMINDIIVINNGKTISAPLFSCNVYSRVNKIPYAQIMYTGISVSDSFSPGDNVKINLKELTIFEGIVMQYRVKNSNARAGGPKLVLELRHTAINLASSRENVVFYGKNDVEIFEEIVKKYSDIQFISEVDGGIAYDQMVQSWCNDWDFMLSRAQANGWSILIQNNQLVLVDLKNRFESNEVKASLDLNKSIICSYDMGVDLSYQSNSVNAESWDASVQKEVSCQDDKGVNLGSFLNKFKSVRNNGQYELSHIGNLSQDEIKAWVYARKSQKDLSLLDGKITISDAIDVGLGDVIEINNLSQYCDGKRIVQSLHYSVSASANLQTELGFGESGDGFVSLDGIQSPPASGLLPGIQSLQIAVVVGYQEISQKQDYQLLVRVKLPLFRNNQDELWARLSSIYAGDGRGIVFRPEEGDEVVLGFFNDDPRFPVILGSMYSDKNKPPVDFDEDNTKKAIVTRDKIKAIFDEEMKSVDIATSENDSIRIVTSSDDVGIYLKDQSKNSFILNKTGIDLKSNLDVKVDSGKSIKFSAKNVKVE